MDWILLFTQDTTIVETVTNTDTWQVTKDVINNLFSYWFTSLVLFSAGNVYITNLVLNSLLPKISNNLLKQGIAILIGLLLALIGYFVEMGMFAEIGLAGAIAKGLEVGWTSNAMYMGYKSSKAEIKKRVDRAKTKNKEKVEASMDKTVDQLEDKFKEDLNK